MVGARTQEEVWFCILTHPELECQDDETYREGRGNPDLSDDAKENN